MDDEPAPEDEEDAEDALDVIPQVDSIDDDDNGAAIDPEIGAAITIEATRNDAAEPGFSWVSEPCELFTPDGRQTRRGIQPIGPQTEESYSFPQYTGNTVPDEIPSIRASILYYFKLLFTNLIFSQFVTQTNQYAAESERKKWKAVNVEEFQRFIAILLWLGLNKVPSMRKL